MTRTILTALVTATLMAPFAASAAEPLASAATNWDGVTLDLLSVERRTNVLTVKWAVRNEADSEQEVRFHMETRGARTYAVDEEKGTKYYVLTDEEGYLLASEHEYGGIREKVPPGGTKRFWMKLPAPPPEVGTLTLFFNETDPFEEVPITDRTP